MATPRDHIEYLRKTWFSIGGETNHLAPMLSNAVEFLSAELYTKDVHFLMEIIQNAEDNDYPEGVDPSLEFVITSRDITATGAPATLLIFNNENGFSNKNIEAICNVGNSTKKGNRKRGYIGEKGIGFKSVFLISAQPYIFSNGYQIRFNEKPCPQCKLGFIVPEWVEESPSLDDIKQIYGPGSSLPTTVIILPLKPDKMKAVKQQLSSIHPEVLLFLSKIKRLSVREDNEDPGLNTVSAIAITKETNWVTRKNIDAESFTLHLSAEGNGNDSIGECSYYIWKQKFPVRQENRVERRMEVEEWVITLAFPNGERLHRGMNAPGVYAFLPTEMVTNFPFIIQADFILASSRETILLDNVWNQGILNCVPFAFVEALISLVRTTEEAPVFNLARMFEFLPVSSSPYPRLNAVRESIKAKLAEENIVPSESCMEQKIFRRPCEIGRIMPEFWNILNNARDEGVSLLNLSSHGWYVLNSSFDQPVYDQILNFLGVGTVNNEWYAKCIRGSNLVMGVSEETYSGLLIFLAENWQSKFCNTDMLNIPLIKYVGVDGSVRLCSVNESARNRVSLCLSEKIDHASWLIDWNREFRCVAKWFFMPRSTQQALWSFSKLHVVWHWLINHAKLTAYNVFEYANVLCNHVGGDRKLVIAYVHFLYNSLLQRYLSESEVKRFCGCMPLVDNYGSVITKWSVVLVPARVSKWVQLCWANPWVKDGYIELGEDYSYDGCYAGHSTAGNELIAFLKTYLDASDIPHITPPNDGIPTVSGPLTKRNAFLLLDWIQNLKYRGINIPKRFLTCIMEGSWLRITMNGSTGYRPPSQSFLLSSNTIKSGCLDVMQNVSVFVDIPLIDQSFYGDEIFKYTEVLKTIGVMFDYGEACEFVGKHLMSIATSSTLTRSNVISVLNFVKFLREKLLSPDKFICSIKKGSWLRTSRGLRSPVGSVLYDQEWRIAEQISDIPFIDKQYYGEGILRFKEELKLLGVIVGFNGSYHLVGEYLRSPLTCLTAEALLLVLDCMRYSGLAEKLVNACRSTRCLKTNLGYKSPAECFWFDPEWGCLLEIFGGFPLIDGNFYGSRISLYKMELKQLGVKVDIEEAVKVFVPTFKWRASSSSITTENVYSLLSCYRQLNGTGKFPSDLMKCIREERWLKTRLGDYRSPRDCILFGRDWESISPITLLPHIDDSDNGYGMSIHGYKNELKGMGVVVELKHGLKFVVAGLRFPQNPRCITPKNVLSLLECIRLLLQQGHSFADDFLQKASQKWIKTQAGYRAPDKCCLFGSEWGLYVKQTDGPFIDEEFYGFDIQSYKKELSIVGVIVDSEKGCSLLANHLASHSEFAAIVRIYDFLSVYQWKSEDEATGTIWVPLGSQDELAKGKWADPRECVLYDKDNLFGLQLNVLEKYYDPKLLSFFSRAFDVKSSPSLDDYCKLWKAWERTRSKLTHAECCAFWRWVVKHRNSKMEDTLADELVKLPVVSGSGEILLFDKRGVFIADDLLLKDLFEKISPRPIFVWYPQPSLPSLPQSKLLDLYRAIGVRTISESVQMKELSLEDVELKQANPSDILIGKGLVRLILGFLADPSFNMEARRRHEAVQCLFNLTVLETLEPINVSYSLSLYSGEIVNAEVSRKLRWDRESSKLFAQKKDRAGGQKSLIEYATYFSKVIAEGVLWEKEDQICALSELIKLAFLLNFDEAAVQYLMKSKNLQIFMEDEAFLSAAFPSG
ncbi:hypothetical protein P3X46_030804 [Hevea brasiliensis]|uniref:Sacsin/Nov domain-containing protein n=1 Tax=Hevea brasiliensis TaxID=3981 RepID=A0ABQ9KJC3_HEVBR|nr:uncharacterized protein LOC110637713 [Hevea brasiliensis]KAJ9140122.1 hypothetical protein P3X46_030804 [Hevea brasiliensis]